MLEPAIKELSRSYFHQAVQYILEAPEIHRAFARELVQFLVKVVPEEKEVIMNAAGWLRLEGLKEGKLQGLEEGERKARREMVLHLMRQGHLKSTISDILGLSEEKIEALLSAPV